MAPDTVKEEPSNTSNAWLAPSVTGAAILKWLAVVVVIPSLIVSVPPPARISKSPEALKVTDLTSSETFIVATEPAVANRTSIRSGSESALKFEYVPQLVSAPPPAIPDFGCYQQLNVVQEHIISPHQRTLYLDCIRGIRHGGREVNRNCLHGTVI